MSELFIKIKSKKLFIFDLDGTLVDSINIWNKVDEEAIRISGKIPKKDFITDTANFFYTCKSPNLYEEYEKYLLKTYKIDSTQEEFSKLRKRLSIEYIKTRVTLRDGVKEILDFLKHNNYMLALATTSDRNCYDIYTNDNQNILRIVNFTNYFSQNVMTEENVKFKKPHPEIYNKTRKKFKLAKKDVIIIEDSITGVTAANRAGIDCICIAEPHSIKNSNFLKANTLLYINSYDELISILKT